MPNASYKWPASEYGEMLIQRLRSRFMPELPHIGVLGPSPNESPEIDPVDIDTSDVPQTSLLEDDNQEDLDWSFTPNKMGYRISISPTENKEDKTDISFYIRIRDGSDADVSDLSANDNQKSDFSLSKADLHNAFRNYKISVFRNNKGLFECAVCVDGREHEMPEGSIAVSNDRIEIKIHDRSDPFLTYEQGTPKLIREKYSIKITKKTEQCGEHKKIITLDVVNYSDRTKPSVPPQIKTGETRAGALARIKSESKKGNDQESTHWNHWAPKLFSDRSSGIIPAGSRYGYLMEFQVAEKISSYEHPISRKDMAGITNSVFDDSNLVYENGKHEGDLIFRDHATFKEKIPKMKVSETPKKICERFGIRKEIGEVLQDDLGYQSMYKFQEDAIAEITKAVNSDQRNTVLVSARTAGGKTESFAVPILHECVKNKKPGVKAIVCYPTKALANDQASRFIELAYHLNKRVDKKITVGILHGDIPKNSDDDANRNSAGLPFECPKCRKGLLSPQYPNKVVCTNIECAESLDFVWANSRKKIYSTPPDILITNPDMLIWRLMAEPEHHGIFGREIYSCIDCNNTYVPSGHKNKCNAKDGCGGKNLEKITPSPPSFLVFDEIHLFKGSFGINTSYLTSRVESAITHYARHCHSIDRHIITRIGSTATISNSAEFVKKFFNVGDGEFSIVPESQKKLDDYYEKAKLDETLNRHHVYLMPYAYTSDSTVGTVVHYLEKLAKVGHAETAVGKNAVGIGKYLQILTFVNSIKASNSLIAQTKRTIPIDLPDIQIDGHTTDFDKNQRSDVEKKFNMQDLHVVFATSTLEVGVDFRNIHCVIINGFPYSFNDYLQRIGRGGRRGDSLVVTVCQNWKPVDHYYYSHGRLAIQCQHQNIEPIPITRDNIEAIRKHVCGSLFDYIMLNSNNHDIDNITSLEKSLNNMSTINESIIASCGIPKNYVEEATEIIKKFVDYIKEQIEVSRTDGKSKSLYSRFKNEINKRYNLTSLRSTDPPVTVEVFWE